MFTNHYPIFFGFIACLSAGSLSAQESKAPGFPPEVRSIMTETQASQRMIQTELEKELQSIESQALREVAMAQAEEKTSRLQKHAGEKILAMILPIAADPQSIDALIWIVIGSRGSTPSDQAAELLQKWHLEDRRTLELSYRHKQSCLLWVRPMLEAQFASPKLTKAETARALYSLATHEQAMSDLPYELETMSESELQLWESTYGKNQVEKFRSTDTAKAETNAIRYFNELVDRFGSDKLADKIEYRTLAKSAIYAMTSLSIGKVAPDIEGEDLDGVAFKLSDYRGKVVLLTFWGTWCPPCMRLIPHEREIAARMNGKEFVIIGVNSDTDKAKLKQDSLAAGITWRSFWCGEKGPLGDIPTKWNIRSWPRSFIIDQQGVIRAKNATGPRLDAVIEELAGNR